MKRKGFPFEDSKTPYGQHSIVSSSDARYILSETHLHTRLSETRGGALCQLTVSLLLVVNQQILVSGKVPLRRLGEDSWRLEKEKRSGLKASLKRRENSAQAIPKSARSRSARGTPEYPSRTQYHLKMYRPGSSCGGCKPPR